MRILLLCLIVAFSGCRPPDAEPDLARFNGVYHIRSSVLDRGLGDGTYVIKAQNLRNKCWSFFFISKAEVEADPTIRIPQDGECCKVKWDAGRRMYRFTPTEEPK